VIDANGQLQVTTETIEHYDGFDPVAYVKSVNVARRHLTHDELRQYVESQLRDHPEKTDRQIARETGVSHPTVAKARANGNSFHNDRREASGRKARGRQPGMVPRPKPVVLPSGEPRLREYADRQMTAIEALSALATATKRTMQTAPPDPADIAAQWNDDSALEAVIAWLQKVRELRLLRCRRDGRQLLQEAADALMRETQSLTGGRP
jgi:hypothetical protein